MEDKPNTLLVQEKIKKMVEHRKKLAKRDSSELTKRLKSNLVDPEYPLPENQEGPNKPQSSIRARRPATGRKPTETMNSITTSSSGNKEV